MAEHSEVKQVEVVSKSDTAKSKGKDEKKSAVPQASMREMFLLADRVDWLCVFLGLLGSMLNGLGDPLVMVHLSHHCCPLRLLSWLPLHAPLLPLVSTSTAAAAGEKACAREARGDVPSLLVQSFPRVPVVLTDALRCALMSGNVAGLLCRRTLKHLQPRERAA